MARRPPRSKRRSRKESAAGTVDEREWEDWRELREEMGKRLGGRGATGVSDPEVLDAARRAKEWARRRR